MLLRYLFAVAFILATAAANFALCFAFNLRFDSPMFLPYFAWCVVSGWLVGRTAAAMVYSGGAT